MNDNLIERKAFADFLLGNYGDTYSQKDVDHYIEHNHVSWLAWKARAAIERQSVPAGYVLVPIDPTFEQIEAAAKAARQYMEEYGGNSPSVVYRAMLAAAPQPQPERQSVPAGYVRFCPECGAIGEVRPTARDCCPDGSHAAYMPEKTAEVCSKLFHDLLAAARQPQPVQEQCPECDGTGTVAGSQAHFPCPICTSPEAQPLSDERLCEAMRKAADELLDHIYEFSTISEGVNPRLLAVGRAVEAAITKGTT